MTRKTDSNVSGRVVNEKDVSAYLERHPNFLTKHPELMAVLAPPKRTLGDSVLDFQHFYLKKLQQNSGELQDKYDGLIEFCRENMSVQAQVHEAVLRLMRVRNLEQLLQAITVDLATLFNLDVVRLAMESPAHTDYVPAYGEETCAGIVFIPEYTCNTLFGTNGAVVLVGDAQANPYPGFEEIFAESSTLVHSCALLRLEQDRLPSPLLLAFGAREKARFDPAQGIDLLLFLSKVVVCQLEKYFLMDVD